MQKSSQTIFILSLVIACVFGSGDARSETSFHEEWERSVNEIACSFLLGDIENLITGDVETIANDIHVGNRERLYQGQAHLDTFEPDAKAALEVLLKYGRKQGLFPMQIMLELKKRGDNSRDEDLLHRARVQARRFYALTKAKREQGKFRIMSLERYGWDVVKALGEVGTLEDIPLLESLVQVVLTGTRPGQRTVGLGVAHGVKWAVEKINARAEKREVNPENVWRGSDLFRFFKRDVVDRKTNEHDELDPDSRLMMFFVATGGDFRLNYLESEKDIPQLVDLALESKNTDIAYRVASISDANFQTPLPFTLSPQVVDDLRPRAHYDLWQGATNSGDEFSEVSDALDNSLTFFYRFGRKGDLINLINMRARALEVKKHNTTSRGERFAADQKHWATVIAEDFDAVEGAIAARAVGAQ